MQINNIQNYQANTSFGRLNKARFKKIPKHYQNLKNVILNGSLNKYSPKTSINGIFNIRGIPLKGTTCEGAIELKNFWKSINPFERENLISKRLGFSTNKDGYAKSFLKTKSSIPISTSFVHDCSVLYMYNESTKEHALYHALHDCEYLHLNKMIKLLMPKGVTKAAIIPGDYYFDKHKHNMRQMFQLIRLNNPNAIINVYHNSTLLPELVGYKGNIYEIPNKKVLEQLKAGNFIPKDYGQASFKISDIQEYNTLQEISSYGSTLEKLEMLKKDFRKRNYSQEIKKILKEKIEERAKVLHKIENVKTIDELGALEYIYSDYTWQHAFIIQKEKFLLKELETISSVEQLKNFYQKNHNKFIFMDNLCTEFQKKKKIILK